LIEDVLIQWTRACDGHIDGQPDLDAFWNGYANRVEFAPSDSGDEFRAEFCPAELTHMDTDDYYRAVWRARVARLRTGADGPSA
jgi:hypothetical protein